MDERKPDNKWNGPSKWAYLFSVAMVLVLVAIMFFTLEKPYEEETAKEIVGAISNCFIVPGALVGGVGALSYISRLGGFDGLTYAFTNFGLHTLFFTNPKKKHTTFYDYKEAKDEKGRKWFPNMLAAGGGALAVGIILTVVYLIM